MKKLFVSLLAGALLFSASAVQAIEFDAVVPITGSTMPAGKMYYPLMNDMDLVFGFSANAPGHKTGELDVDFVLGVATPLPLLGDVDLLLAFDKYSGSSTVGTTTGTVIHLEKFVVSKKWIYKLTDSLNLGLEGVLAEVYLNGGKNVTIMKSIYPVVSASIDIL